MNETELQEEMFCLKFELDSLSELVTRRSGERWLSGFAPDFVEHDHKQRYLWALPYVAQKDVLDIACGAGKGSYMMAELGSAKSVIGCDLFDKAIRYARHRNRHERVTFEQRDALDLEFVEAFDVVVSFETIEHLPDVEMYLGRVRAALRQGGTYLVSTPIANKPLDTAPANAYHTQEWGFTAFQELVGKYFEISRIFLQLYPPVPGLRAIRATKTLLSRLDPGRFSGPSVSHISEFAGQYPVSELGRRRVGFQVLVCRKKELSHAP